MWHTSGCGRIELNITRKQAAAGSHPGQCDVDIVQLSQAPAIQRQLQKIDPALLAEVLREYGAWDADELKDHDQNLRRYLWIACCDISEGNC